MTTPVSGVSVEAQNFNWLVARFANETAGVLAAIAVSSDGRLFVLEPNNRILVFAPGANGDLRPSQIIEDAGPVETLGTGIAVRSVDCAFVRRPPPGEPGQDGR